MNLAKTLTAIEAKKAQSFVLLTGVFTTLAIWTPLEDPVNLPKMFVLILLSSISLGLALPAIFNITKLASVTLKITLGSVALFVIGILTATFKTDVIYVAIFGEYHRNNGAFSYLAMVALMVVGALVFNLKTSGRYLKFFAVTGLFLTFYGFLQGAGIDPVGWKIDYNPFITTLGNPNFTSGFLGISAIAILLLAVEAKDVKYRLIYSLGLLANFYILYKSGSIQGVFGFLIGAAIIILVKLWLINKRYGQVGLALTAVAGLPVALAILNIGPLASKLYQGTLRNRLDYWNAALSMFKDHPTFGIGIDRFGEYYRQYAEQNQVVQGQITDNAHSVYMQILATGGLVTFVPYILLISLVTYLGFRALLKSSGSDKLRIGGIFGIWLATVVINVVTIDNLGVGVWFWITGGVLIAISAPFVSSNKKVTDLESNGSTGNQSNSSQDLNKSLSKSLSKSSQNNKVKSKKAKSKQVGSEFPVTTIMAGLLALVILVITLPEINKSLAIRGLLENKQRLTTVTYVDEIKRQIDANSNNPKGLILLANIALQSSNADLANQISDRVRQLDARSYYGHYFPAIAYEGSGKIAEAIKSREKLIELDPWNTANMLQLIKDYLAVSDRGNATRIAAKIKENYPGSQSDIDATALLVG
jgi:O-antigen ligase